MAESLFLDASAGISKVQPGRWWFLLLALPLSVALGCGDTGAKAKVKPDLFPVAQPVEDTLIDSAVFTGRTQAVNSAEIRARVTGYLFDAIGPEGPGKSVGIRFREGDFVKKNDPLFLIDPRPFEALLNQAQANLAQQQAQLKYSEGDYLRTTSIRATGAVSADDIAKSLAGRDNAKAAVESAQAAVATAKLNLEYTKVLAPFDGRIGRRQVDPGSLVQQDNTVLATLVQLDPIYGYFDVDERTLLQIRALLTQERITSESKARVPVTLGLADESPDSFSHHGEIAITDNKVDSSTGTLRIWGKFENKKQDLYPNLFVRVALGFGEPRKHRFVDEKALGSRQGNDFLYVAVPARTKEGEVKLAEDKKTFLWEIQEITVKVGQHKNGLIAIEAGLEVADKAIAAGLEAAAKVDAKVRVYAADDPERVAKEQKDWQEARKLKIVVNNLQRVKVAASLDPEQLKTTEMDPAKRPKEAAAAPKQ